MSKRTERKYKKGKERIAKIAHKEEIEMNAAQAQADIPHTPFAVSKKMRKRINGKSGKWGW